MTEKSCKTGLANFNAQEDHIIRRDEPGRRIYAYTYRMEAGEGGGLNETRNPLFTDNDICFSFPLMLNATNIFD
jgi:hypothetical protein